MLTIQEANRIFCGHAKFSCRCVVTPVYQAYDMKFSAELFGTDLAELCRAVYAKMHSVNVDGDGDIQTLKSSTRYGYKVVELDDGTFYSPELGKSFTSFESMEKELRYKSEGLILLDEFQKFLIFYRMKYSGVDENNELTELSLGLTEEYGKVFISLRKYIRGFEISETDLRDDLGELLAYSALIANHFGINLGEAAQSCMNVNKALLSDMEFGEFEKAFSGGERSKRLIRNLLFTEVQRLELEQGESGEFDWTLDSKSDSPGWEILEVCSEIETKFNLTIVCTNIKDGIHFTVTAR